MIQWLIRTLAGSAGIPVDQFRPHVSNKVSPSVKSSSEKMVYYGIMIDNVTQNYRHLKPVSLNQVISLIVIVI